jgi:hypothetical protein
MAHRPPALRCCLGLTWGSLPHPEAAGGGPGEQTLLRVDSSTGHSPAQCWCTKGRVSSDHLPEGLCEAQPPGVEAEAAGG